MIRSAPTADTHWLDAERIRVYPWMVVIIFVLVTAWWTARSLPDLVDPFGKPVGYDFIAFWSAAKLAVQGRPEAAFDWNAIHAAHRLAVPTLGDDKLFLWHYPPTYLLMMLPLGLLPYPIALIGFLAATAGLWAWLVRRILPDPRAWIVAAALPAGLINLMHGQNGFLTAALAGFALLALDRRPILAGVLIGLLAIKPHLAVLFPVALIAAGRWKALTAAAASTIAFTAVSAAVVGWPFVEAFLHDLPITRQLIDTGSLHWGMMPSAQVFARSLAAPPALATLLQAAVALAAAGCAWRVWRRPEAPFEAKAATLLAGSLLVSPYVFYYDLTWAGLAIAWLATLGLRDGFRRGEREILFLAWLAPVMMQPLHLLTALQIGFPALVLLLFVATRRATPFAVLGRPEPNRSLQPSPRRSCEMSDRDAFCLSSLVPLFYLLILFYAVAAIILVPFGLPVLRCGEGEALLVALASCSLCVAGMYLLHSERAQAMTPSVRKAALFSASVGLLSFASYIATTGYFSIKPAIPIINPHIYDQALAQAEAWLFAGTLPSLWLIERVNAWQLVALDASYNLFMPGLALSLMGAVYLKGLKGGVRLSIAQFIGLYLCLLVSLALPTHGPMFLYPDQFLPKLATMPTGQMAHFLRAGISEYRRDPYNVSLVAGLAAMPSYHVFSWACGLMYWRLMPKPVLALALLACAVDWLCTVALGWHYVLDGLVSLLLVVPIWKLTDAFIGLALRLPAPPARRGAPEMVPSQPALAPLTTPPQ